jgi:lysozyme
MINALTLAVQISDSSEGFSATAYLDSVANPPVWTIGHGTTRINGEPVTPGTVCTMERADRWAMIDMTAAAHFVAAKVTVPLTDQQLAALISLCYNIGDGNFERSPLLTEQNLGHYLTVADDFLEYDEAGDKVIRGLLNRRKRERALYLTGLSGAQWCVTNADSESPVIPTPTPPAPTADDLNEAELRQLGDEPT